MLIFSFNRVLAGARLVHQRVKRRRNRLLVIMLLPAAALIGFIGWCLYVLGDQKKATKRKTAPVKPYKKDNVTLMPIILDEQEEIKIPNSTS